MVTTQGKDTCLLHRLCTFRSGLMSHFSALLFFQRHWAPINLFTQIVQPYDRLWATFSQGTAFICFRSECTMWVSSQADTWDLSPIFFSVLFQGLHIPWLCLSVPHQVILSYPVSVVLASNGIHRTNILISLILHIQREQSLTLCRYYSHCCSPD